MKRIYFILEGVVLNISDTKKIKRKNKVPDLLKRIITIKTNDDQKLFGEIRNKKLSLITDLNIQVGNNIKIYYCFEGSEKNNKLYNNIYINNIEKL